jgi:excisionase family DNA binding protein
MAIGQTANDAAPLLTPAEVAAAFRVDPKTVTRWAKSGKLSSIRTLGGHRRYLATEIHAILTAVPSSFDLPSSEKPNPFLPWNGSQIHG